jgi:hypothetical protein
MFSLILSISIVGNGNASLVSCSFTASRIVYMAVPLKTKQFVGFQTAVYE